MSRWSCLTRVRWRAVATPQWLGRPRLLSTHPSVEHVRVPCASAGHITVSLHNISNHDPSTPLVIVLPPFSRQETSSANQLPSCFQDYPTAVINYRWQGQEQKGDERPEHPLHWPTPLHDVNFGYSWIMNNLGSGTDASAKPRHAYVYGSYLGASLAAGLALTESHVPAPPRPMTVRGLIAYNGIYNWTMFLPDHPVQRLRSESSSRRRRRRGLASAFVNLNEDAIEEEGIFTDLKHHAPGLFADPSNLFDPFASACFFFHSANLHVPDDFTTPLSASAPVSTLSSEFTAAIDALANRSPSPSTSAEWGGGGGEEGDGETAAELLSRAAHLAKQQKPPRKSYLVFPPRDSTLRLPRALFLYSSPQYGPRPPAGFSDSSSSSRSRRKQGRNSFAAQTAELAGLMMRSLDLHELRRRGGGTGRPGKQFPRKDITAGANAMKEEGEGVADGEEDRWKEIERRVQTFEVSLPSSPSSFSFEEGLGLEGEAEQVIAEWLREKIDEDFGGEEEEEEEGRDGP
ncbi:uncharacterized protein P884DRAFT_249652 [Thermothelomyces heterothallicus CBS 202.75]|uniref:uncharacterized protein n=1 Tax=Thermothelomyces heterothallicus CBS 202.75 TaxID=1149848 RepID=UPI0037422E7A